MYIYIYIYSIIRVVDKAHTKQAERVKDSSKINSRLITCQEIHEIKTCKMHHTNIKCGGG